MELFFRLKHWNCEFCCDHTNARSGSMMVTLVSFALFATTMMAVLAVMFTTLLPAMPRIIALLTPGRAAAPAFADWSAIPTSRRQMQVSCAATASARYPRQPLRVAA